MKKLIFTLLVLFVAASANADGLDRLARKYKKYDGAVYAASIDELGKLKSTVVKEKKDGIVQFADKLKQYGVRKMRVLKLNDCTFEVKARYAIDSKKAVPSGYEGFLNFDDDDGRFSIYIQKRKGYMKFLLLVTGNDDCGFLEIESDNDILNNLLNFD